MKRSEAEAETRARYEPKFVTDPPVPDEPGFIGEYTRHENAKGLIPSGAAIAAASEIERLYGAEACIEVATDLAWEKHPNYLKPILEDRKNGRAKTLQRNTAGRGTQSTGAGAGIVDGWDAYERGE